MSDVPQLARAHTHPGPFYGFLRAVMQAIVGVVLFRSLHVEGEERVPRSGALLVVSNHIASADPPILGAIFPRPLHFMAKMEWYKTPWLAWLARQYLCFPVVRHTADRASLRFALDLLAAGEALCIYPEGTRAEDAQLHRPEAGAGFLAARSGALILPVAIWGSEKVLPKGSHWPKRADTHMVYGEPFSLPHRDMDRQEAADLMMWHIAQLLPAEYRGHFKDWSPPAEMEEAIGARQPSEAGV